MKVTVEVTEDDIAKGQRHNPRFCPVAYAVSRRMNVQVEVGVSEIWLVVDGLASGLSERMAELPVDVRNWITCFDAEQEVWPITFEMNLVEYTDDED